LLIDLFALAVLRAASAFDCSIAVAIFLLLRCFAPQALLIDSCSPKRVGSSTSGVTDSHGVTGGVYKTRERIHRDMLIRDY
jgi:hypothetical protein